MSGFGRGANNPKAAQPCVAREVGRRNTETQDPGHPAVVSVTRGVFHGTGCLKKAPNTGDEPQEPGRSWTAHPVSSNASLGRTVLPAYCRWSPPKTLRILPQHALITVGIA